LTLDDERIFNAIIGQLTPERQTAIMGFLHQCKDYERSRFIVIVSGMEVSPGKPAEEERKFDKDGKTTYEKIKKGSDGLDCRKKFLESFADLIIGEFGNDFAKAYAYCIAGKIIISDPLYRKALRNFSESIAEVRKVILTPLGVDSFQQAVEKAGNKLKQGFGNVSADTKSFENSARARFEAAKANSKK